MGEFEEPRAEQIFEQKLLHSSVQHGQIQRKYSKINNIRLNYSINNHILTNIINTIDHLQHLLASCYNDQLQSQRKVVARGPKLNFPEFNGEDCDGQIRKSGKYFEME